MADSKKESGSGKTSKKTTAPPQPSTSKDSEKTQKHATRSEKSKDESADQNAILKALQSIQASQSATEQKFDALYERVKNLEDYGPGGEYVDYGYGDSYEGFEDGEVFDASYHEETGHSDDGPSSPKRSRFAAMSKKLKGYEQLGPAIDQTLAENINHVFQNGLDEDQYQSMIREDALPRPENCPGLTTVKCNKLVWDFLSTNARYFDKRLQHTETSLVKGAVLVAQAVHGLASMESVAKEKGVDLSPVVDKCQDALSLFGHANKQLNMSRREALRPEMRSQYSHLCSSTKPVTQFLFGDDIEKDAKEIEDTAKIGQKMQYESSARFHRGRPAYRGRFPRGRGGFRPRGASGFGGASSYDPKNHGRRGNLRFPQKRQ